MYGRLASAEKVECVFQKTQALQTVSPFYNARPTVEIRLYVTTIVSHKNNFQSQVDLDFSDCNILKLDP